MEKSVAPSALERRRERDKLRAREKRANETPEERERRLRYHRDWWKKNPEMTAKANARRSREAARERADPTSAGRRRVYSLRHYTKKAAALTALKNKPCMDCGGTFPTCCMDFDHRDPSTKNRKAAGMIALAARVGWDEVLAEIAKCDIVCANCHRIRTVAQRKAGTIRKNRPKPRIADAAE